MFARVTIFDDVDLSLEQEALAWTSAEGLGSSRGLVGYRGHMTLMDREERRLVGIGFYDSVDDARQADRLFGRVPPESMPDELRRALPRQQSVGVFEVMTTQSLTVVQDREPSQGHRVAEGSGRW